MIDFSRNLSPCCPLGLHDATLMTFPPKPFTADSTFRKEHRASRGATLITDFDAKRRTCPLLEERSAVLASD